MPTGIYLRKPRSEETKRKIGLANNKEKNGLWKGNSVGLSALHNWIRRNKPKPEFYEKWHFKN